MGSFGLIGEVCVGLLQGSLGDPGKHVDFFFQEYYQSAGEPLPKESRRTSRVLQQTVDADVTQVVQGKEQVPLLKI